MPPVQWVWIPIFGSVGQIRIAWLGPTLGAWAGKNMSG